MDCQIFTERLRALAGLHHGFRQSPSLDSYQIMGRLGLVLAARRAQAAVLGMAMVVVGVYGIKLVQPSQLSMLGIALGYALVMLIVLRRFPYWSPRKPLSEGLMALSECRLNDPANFLSGIRSDLHAVNNAMLSELCMLLALDRRRSNAGSNQ
ncbi:TPA: hypothetical protein R1W95_000934 [Pseudomonas aeruginosa]|nr:hypothetical protein [Pseudomonas aeruginosa]HEC1424148.1 hypothetical protein [Pseudomonas aeruginosa]